jgi:rubrerythrin
MAPVKTTGDLLAIAGAMERAAATRYALLSDSMRRFGHDHVADVFQSLAEEECSHVEQVDHLMAGLKSQGPVADVDQWSLPDTFILEQTGAAASLTPYEALSIAVKGEERAFSFWTYVATEAESEDVKAQAEMLARQELAHAAKLRIERRRAFHADTVPKQKLPPAPVDAATVNAVIATREADCADFLRAATIYLERLNDEESAGLVRELSHDFTRNDLPPIPEGRVQPVLERASSVGPAGILFEVAGSIERVLEYCVALIARAAHGEGVAEAKSHAERATTAAVKISARLLAIEPSLGNVLTPPLPSPKIH